MSDRLAIPHNVNGTHATQTAFCLVLPRISRHARFYFRYLKRKHDHEEAVAESVALAWKWYLRLLQQGKHPDEFVSAIATYATRAVKSGRRLCGQERAKDILSRRAQTRRGFAVSRFPEFSTLTGNALGEALHDNATTPVPDQVSFRIDFPEWLATRSRRDRELIGRLITGERCLDAAHRFGISPSRITQLRREYMVAWRLYCDEPV
jgi:DNA-directed RNA polymerase specialized sigma24 family protein